jgi:DNA-binding CsgD family transcriptional regulator
MRQWYETRLKEFAEHSVSEEALHREIASSANALHFDFWMFGVRLPVPFSRPAFEARGNYPLTLQRRCRDSVTTGSDPILRHCKTSSIPLLWNTETPASDHQYWSELKAQGIRYGWSLPMKGHLGALTWFTLARTSSPLHPDELADIEYPMIWLARFAQSRISEPLILLMFDGEVPRLSSREREVMTWTAEGKTASEIGLILGIAESTCIFHITNAARKLGAVNKTHAAARAAALGLIG